MHLRCQRNWWLAALTSWNKTRVVCYRFNRRMKWTAFQKRQELSRCVLGDMQLYGKLYMCTNMHMLIVLIMQVWRWQTLMKYSSVQQ